MTELTVILPTVDGREEHAAKFKESLHATTEGVEVELFTFLNEPTCGAAWALGIPEADGLFTLLAADDLILQPGWYQAASRAVSEGYLPAPRIIGPDGNLESCGEWGVEMQDGAYTEFTRIPFGLTTWLKETGSLTCHYYTDNWISWYAREVMAIDTRVCRGFEVQHMWAQAARGAGMSQDERMQHDYTIFAQAIQARKAS